MKWIHTIDGEIKSEGSTTASKALDFLRKYPWDRIGRIDLDHAVVEEIGRNTRRVFGFGYSGSPSEILPLLRFLYLHTALRAACFCSPDPDWRERIVRSAADELRRFPKETHVPLPILCSCTQREEFRDLAELLSANIKISSTPILLEPGVIPGWPYSVVPGNSLITMMMLSGISEKETVKHAIRFVSENYSKNDDNAFTALELHREGTCSFDEALAMA